MRKVFRIGDTLQVFKLGTTTNEKIVDSQKEKIVQSYTFSRKQFELLSTGTNDGMKTFFSNADSNCLDCPFNEFGKCYTHKFNQYVGFLSMLKSIISLHPTWDSLPTEVDIDGIIAMSKDKYVRFGTYGEPSLHPLALIEGVTAVSKSWTGYTHQWKKNDLSKFYMASVHSASENIVASVLGYRSFIVSDQVQEVVSCPASKESGYKSSCNQCNLCSGTLGTKSKKSVFILTH